MMRGSSARCMDSKIAAACAFSFVLIEQKTAERLRLAPDEDVLRRREVPHQAQFLMNDGNAQGLRLLGTCDLSRHAAEADLSGVARIDPSQDLHQRRFPGAVLTHQGVDFAREQLKARLR